ncbi:MAG: sulfatase-like hydrolase/transferase [Candidatus Binatia bacterium]|nr:sulfatase-like hydrolase/transferase [Candidatus Binatia bacterium]
MRGLWSAAGLGAILTVAAASGWLVARAAQKPSVVLVSLGAVRADVLQPWAPAAAVAGDGPVAPTLAHLCDVGICFTQAYSNAPYARAAAATALTGGLAAEHGVRGPLDRLASARPQLAELFATSGYDTGAVAGSYEVDRVFGFRGFSQFDDRFYQPIVDSARDPLPIPSLVFHDWSFALSSRLSKLTANARKPDSTTTDSALAFLAMHRQRPFFLWVHYFGASPLGSLEGQVVLPPERYAERVRQLDRELKRLVEGLVELDLDRRVWLFVYGDAGFALFEHGEHGVAASLYESSVRVPLVVVPPREQLPTRGRRRVDTPVSLLDLAPTITEVVELPVQVAWPVGGFARLLQSPTASLDADRPIPLENYAPRAIPGTGVRARENLEEKEAGGMERMRGVRRQGWKYLVTESLAPFAARVAEFPPATGRNDKKREELYDLRSDPMERNNLASQETKVCAELNRLLPAVPSERLP